MNYEMMTDQEINTAAAEAVGLDVAGDSTDGVRVAIREAGRGRHPSYTERDYCNSWADAGPIIDEHGINIHYVSCPAGSGFAPSAECDGHHSGYQASATRAAMLSFLKMMALKAMREAKA